MVGQHYRWGGPFWGNYQYDFVESFKATTDTTLFTQSECPIARTPPGVVPAEPFARCPELRALAEARCPSGSRFNDCMMDVGETCELDPWVGDARQDPPVALGSPPPTPLQPAIPDCRWDTCASMEQCRGAMTCSSTGDPHMHMFSGRSGHPQGVGPYVMAQSLDKSFAVQVCHRQVKRGFHLRRVGGWVIRALRPVFLHQLG